MSCQKPNMFANTICNPQLRRWDGSTTFVSTVRIVTLSQPSLTMSSRWGEICVSASVCIGLILDYHKDDYRAYYHGICLGSFCQLSKSYLSQFGHEKRTPSLCFLWDGEIIPVSCDSCGWLHTMTNSFASLQSSFCFQNIWKIYLPNNIYSANVVGVILF